MLPGWCCGGEEAAGEFDVDGDAYQTPCSRDLTRRVFRAATPRTDILRVVFAASARKVRSMTWQTPPNPEVAGGVAADQLWEQSFPACRWCTDATMELRVSRSRRGHSTSPNAIFFLLHRSV